jgi:hypothetical protein
MTSSTLFETVPKIAMHSPTPQAGFEILPKPPPHSEATVHLDDFNMKPIPYHQNRFAWPVPWRVRLTLSC